MYGAQWIWDLHQTKEHLSVYDIVPLSEKLYMLRCSNLKELFSSIGQLNTPYDEFYLQQLFFITFFVVSYSDTYLRALPVKHWPNAKL
jgi:hypothetical protein